MEKKMEMLEAIERDARTLLDEMDAANVDQYVLRAMASLRNNLLAMDKLKAQEALNDKLKEFFYAAMDNHGILDVDDDDDSKRDDIFNDILYDMKAHGYVFRKADETP